MPRARPEMSYASPIATSGVELGARARPASLGVEPLPHLLAVGRDQMLVRERLTDGFSGVSPGSRLAISGRHTMRPFGLSVKASSRRAATRRARSELARQHLGGGVARGLAVDAVARSHRE